MNWLEIQMAIMTVAANAIEFATNWLVQSTLLIAIGLLIARLMRRQGSAAASMIYRTTLVAVLICPLATWALGQAGVSGWSIPIEPGFSFEQTPVAQADAAPRIESIRSMPAMKAEPAQAVDTTAALPPTAVPSTAIEASTAMPAATPMPSIETVDTAGAQLTVPAAELWTFDVTWFGLLSPFVLVGWAIVSLYLIFRLGTSWWRMSRLVRSASQADESTRDHCDQLATQLGVSSPKVLRSPFISSPCLAGLGLTKPANILLPADDVELPIRDVLVHELAHLSRRDCHWNLLRQLSTAVYFFQPLLWVLSRRIEFSAEEVCDDIVVHSGGNREDYAHRLVDIAELSTQYSAAAVAAAGVGIVSLRSMLARRVERILDTRRSLSTRVGNLLMIAVLFGGITGTAIVGLVGLNQLESIADEQEISAPETEASQTDKTDEPDRKRYSGKVVDQQGNPVSGADLYLTCYIPEPLGLYKRDFKPVAQSAGDGTFEFDFAPSDLGPSATTYEFKYSSLVAVKKGYGFAVSRGDQFQETATEPTIKLAPDHPIRGRIIDINGEPVSGARLTLFRVYSNDKHDLTDWTAEATKPRSDFYKAREHVPKINSGSLVRSVVQPGVTNAKGEFVMTGVGKGRVVRLLLEGEQIQTQLVRVRTEPGEKISLLKEARRPESGSWTYYPAEFQHICGPSIPVTGVVRDKQTGEPIAGATIKSQRIHGIRTSGWGSDYIRAVTDANGRYRLTGLPVGTENRIGAIVPDGQIAYPSLSNRADTSIAAGDADQREVNFDMTRGVWLSGRITDAESGRGVVGSIRYFADRSNPNSKLLRRGVDERDRLRPDEDGRFRIPAISGKGYLTFLANPTPRGVDYPRATTIIKPDGSEIPTPVIMDTAPYFITPQNNHVIAEVEPKADDREIEVNLTLSSGKKRTGIVIGPDKKPLKGFRYYGDTRHFSSWKQVNGTDFTLKDIRANVPRHVYVVDPNRNLAGYAKVLGEADEPLEINVGPAGRVKGRVVDEDGEPLAFRPLTSLGRSIPAPGKMMDTTPHQPPLFSEKFTRGRFETDAEGRFEFSCLLPDTEYRLSTKPKDDPPYFLPLNVVIKVDAGETKDLGDVQVSDDPNLFKEFREFKKPKESSKPKPKDVGNHSLDASIVLPDGKPAGDTHVALIGYDRDARKAITFAEAVTDGDGKCTLVCKTKINSDPENPKTIIARRDGFGIGWNHLSSVSQGKAVMVKLHNEGAIEGKLIDIEGEPAAGEKLQIGFVIDPSVKPSTMDAMTAYHDNEQQWRPKAWPSSITTNEKGWFRLTGVPKDHGLWMSLINSKKFAPQEISLNTGQSEQRGERDGTYRPLIRNLSPGEEAILTLSPGKIITGTITYEDTGKPVANGKISVWASQQKYGSMSSVTCMTDAEGKYRILPKPGIRFGVTAYPPEGVPYMARKAEDLDWENSDVTREVDIKLPRVVLVRGRVLEEGTDKPVAGAKITFERGEKSSMMPKNVVTGWQAERKTDVDGRFTFAAPPGRGTLLVRKFGGNYVLEHRVSRQLRYGLPGGERVYAHALKLITTKKGDDTVDVEIRLTPGQKASGKIVDEQGELVDKALIATNLKVWDTSGRWRGGSNDNTGGTFELLGLESGKDHPVYFLDAKRKLGATVNLRGGDENVTVKLKPCGQARAKFNLDDPDRKFDPTIYFVATPGVGKYEYTKWKMGLVAADTDFNSNVDRINYRLPGDGLRKKDADGYYTFPALIPGATYRLFTREAGDWDYKDFTVKSGETLDLGEFTPKFDD